MEIKTFNVILSWSLHKNAEFVPRSDIFLLFLTSRRESLLSIKGCSNLSDVDFVQVIYFRARSLAK